MSPDERAPRGGKSALLLAIASLAIAAVGVVGWILSLSGNLAQGWRALLVSFLFFTPLAAGLVTWSPIVLLSHGRWPGEVERLTATGMTFALPSLAALGILWYGGSSWAPWYGSELHQGAWLHPPALFARDLVLLAGFWVLAHCYLRRRRAGEGRVVGAWTIIAYCVVFSVLGFDLVMGLDPEWYSSLFGGYFFISGLYVAVCAWALLAVLAGGRDRERLHDLGKLVFAFSILTTYLMFSQLLPIWYENLPREIRYVVPRVNFAPWSIVSWCILGTVWLGPLALLLTIRAKRSPWLLAPISLILLLGMWVERWWLVAPTFQRELDFGWAEASTFCALLGIFVCGTCWSIWRGLPHLPHGGDER